MFSRLWRNLALIISLGFIGCPILSHAADETLVAGFLAKRQALVADGKVDIADMSLNIRNAITEGERLEREGKSELALQRVLALQKFMPLFEIPSYQVHLLASWLYMKAGNSEVADMHRARASAMYEVLVRRNGNGQSPESPVQVVMVNDISEWARMQSLQIADVKTRAFQRKELMVVTYSGPLTNGKPSVAYFQMDPRVQAIENAKRGWFTPFPLEQMTPDAKTWLELGKAKREAFLRDTSIPYLALIGQIEALMNRASKLEAQGDAIGAIAALKEIDSIRPIEDIPLPSLIAAYSKLQGDAGNQKKQDELRGLLFGINQAIAHSGDGLTPETAVQVIAVQEEYLWLSDKRLTRVRQEVLETSVAKFDLITARNANGEQRDYYFNITKMFAMYGQHRDASLNK